MQRGRVGWQATVFKNPCRLGQAQRAEGLRVALQRLGGAHEALGLAGGQGAVKFVQQARRVLGKGLHEFGDEVVAGALAQPGQDGGVDE